MYFIHGPPVFSILGLREIGTRHCDAAQQSAGRGLALARDFFVLRFLVAALLAPEEWRVATEVCLRPPL